MSGSQYLDQAALYLGPDGNAAGASPVNRAPQALTAVATAEASTTGFDRDSFVTIVNTSATVPLRYAMAGLSGLSNVVTAAMPTLAPGAERNHFITPRTRFVYIKSTDGIATVTASVWQSSGAPDESL